MASSATEEFRPCRRVLTPGFSGANHARAQGVARVEPSPRLTPRPTGLRTNADASRRSGYDIPDPGLVVSRPGRRRLGTPRVLWGVDVQSGGCLLNERVL